MKKVLFYNPVPWTYHVKSARFLANFFKKSGYEVVFITCNSRRNSCYPKQLNGDTKFQCVKCGIANSYLLRGYQTVFKVPQPNLYFSNVEPHWSSKGSVLSANREELESNRLDEQYSYEIQKTNEDFINLKVSISETILTLKPDLCMIFNGRTHDTAAATDACKETQTRFITMERPWFGQGIQLIDGHDCISIEGFNEAIYGRKSKNASRENKEKSFDFIKNRLAGNDNGEWRNYGQKMSEELNVLANKYGKFSLVVPSSRSEFIGHPEYSLDGMSSIEFIECFLDKFIAPKVENIVIKAHPAWFRKIGKFKVSRAHFEYLAMAKRLNVTYIPPNSDISTYDLMKVATVSIFNGSSSICEATELGKRVINLGPHRFGAAGFFKSFSRISLITDDEVRSVLQERIEDDDKNVMYDFIARYLENMVFFSSSFPSEKYKSKSSEQYEDGEVFRSCFNI